MSAPHTPGPWRIKPGDSTTPYATLVQGTAGATHLAYIKEAPGLGHAAKANAALIAAAPDLLEALEDLLENCRQRMLQDPAMGDAARAIAKARREV